MEPLPPELLAGAVMDSTGTFTVALDKARDKLKRFQLPDPRNYILQIIQAIVASGATEISATLSGWAGELTDVVPDGVSPGYRLCIQWDGPGYTYAELTTLFDHIFESQRHRQFDRLREMALGLLSCQALEPSILRLASGDTEWVRKSDDDIVIRRRPEPRLAPLIDPSTGSPLRRKGVLNLFEVARFGTSTEAELLRETCQALPVSLQINNDSVNLSNQLSSATPWPAWSFDVRGMTGCVGLPYTRLTESRIDFFRYGVRISAKNEPNLYPPVVIKLDHPGLRKNVSQSDIVEDGVYQECISELQELLVNFAANLCQRRIPSYQQGAVQTFLLDLVSEWIPTPLLLCDTEEVPPDLLPLFSMPIFCDRQGRPRSLREVIPFFLRDGFVSTLKAKYHNNVGDWLMLCPSNLGEKTALKTLFENTQDVSDLVSDWASLSPKQLAGLSISPTTLVERRVECGNRVFRLSLGNCYPRGKCMLRINDRLSTRVQPSDIFGWSVVVDGTCSSTDELELVLHLALDAAVTQSSALYRSLFERLASNFGGLWNTEPYMRRRSIEHLAAWWLSCLDGGVEGGGNLNIPRFGPDMWGGAVWTTRIFDTRTGSPTSLADMRRWVDDSRSIITTYGGKRLVDDYAIDASPNVLRFLRRIFGKDKVVRATLGARYWEERGLQRMLPGASERKTLTSENPMRQAELPATSPPSTRPVPGGGESAGVRMTVLPAGSRPVPPPPPPAPIPAKAKEAEVSASPPPPSLEPGPIKAPDMVSYATHEFAAHGLHGSLRLDPTPSRVCLQVEGGAVTHETLFGLPVGGTLQVPRPLAQWDDAQVHQVRAAVMALYERMVSRMRQVGEREPSFAVMRALLLQFIVVYQDDLQRRLASPKLQDQLINLRFLPRIGDGPVSLLTLWVEARIEQKLEVMPVGSEPPPMRDFAPAEVGGAVPIEFYRAIFSNVVQLEESCLDPTPMGRLTTLIRRDLRKRVARGEAELSETVLADISSRSMNGCFVHHDVASGTTYLNSNHAVWRDAARRFDTDRSIVPLLVTSVYHSIRRTMHDMVAASAYEGDVRFLTNLLKSAPSESLPPAVVTDSYRQTAIHLLFS